MRYVALLPQLVRELYCLTTYVRVYIIKPVIGYSIYFEFGNIGQNIIELSCVFLKLNYITVVCVTRLVQQLGFGFHRIFVVGSFRGLLGNWELNSEST